MNTLTVITSLFLAISPAVASERFQPCQFNSGKWIQIRNLDNGPAFTLEWDDGPKMTYVWRGSNADQWNITDTKGGRWHYHDHRSGGGFELTNLDNKNEIRCLGTVR